MPPFRELNTRLIRECERERERGNYITGSAARGFAMRCNDARVCTPVLVVLCIDVHARAYEIQLFRQPRARIFIRNRISRSLLTRAWCGLMLVKRISADFKNLREN